MTPITIIKYSFTAIGALLLAGTFVGYQKTSDFMDRANRAPGRVVDLIETHSRDSEGSTSTLYKPVVAYTDAQGQTRQLTSSVASSPPGFDIGEAVEVLYIPGDERNAEINATSSLWLGHLIAGGLGSVFFLIGVGFFVVSWLRAGKESQLRSQGMPVQAAFQRVELNRSFEVNGRHPFRLVAQWQNPTTSELHVFESDNLWFDPTPFVTQKQLTVFIDAANPRRYHVDTSFLPKLAR